jgi:hypothetical protein
MEDVDLRLGIDQTRDGAVGRGSESESSRETEPLEASSPKSGALSGVKSSSLTDAGRGARTFWTEDGSSE